jgi:hypothetical protein
MERLRGQRGLPSVAPDVPADDLDEAFSTDPPEPEYALVAVVFEGVRQSEIEAKLTQMAMDVGARLYVVDTRYTEE